MKFPNYTTADQDAVIRAAKNKWLVGRGTVRELIAIIEDLDERLGLVVSDRDDIKDELVQAREDLEQAAQESYR